MLSLRIIRELVCIRMICTLYMGLAVKIHFTYNISGAMCSCSSAPEQLNQCSFRNTHLDPKQDALAFREGTREHTPAPAGSLCVDERFGVSVRPRAQGTTHWHKYTRTRACCVH